MHQVVGQGNSEYLADCLTRDTQNQNKLVLVKAVAVQNSALMHAVCRGLVQSLSLF